MFNSSQAGEGFSQTWREMEYHRNYSLTPHGEKKAFPSEAFREFFQQFF